MGIETAIIGSAILGAGASAYAASKSSKAAQQASDAATAEQRRQFDMTRQDQMPWLQAGNAALNARMGLLGIGGGGGVNALSLPAASGATNWASYGQTNPDVAAAWNNPLVQKQFNNDPNAYYQWHYGTFGQNEGRQRPAATGMPAGAGAQSGSGSSDPYDAFLNSGYARSMLETTNADFDQMVGAFGAAGNALSGSAIGALNDRNRRNTAQAFNMYDNALGGISNTGQVTASALGNAGMNMANNVGNIAMNAAQQKGSSYQGAANALNSGLQNATNAYAYGLGNGWFGSGGGGGASTGGNNVHFGGQ